MYEWEGRYIYLKSVDCKDRLDELQEKINERNAKENEVKEYNRLKKSIENLSKVDKVVKYKDELKLFFDKINEEIKCRKELRDLNKEEKNLDYKLIKLKAEEERLKEELKIIKDKESEEYSAKKQELSKCIGDISLNSNEYSKVQLGKEKYSGRDEKFSERSTTDLKNLALKAKSSMTKCDIVIKNLINGKNMNAIEFEVKKFEKEEKFKKVDDLKNKDEKEEKPKEKKTVEKQEKTGEKDVKMENILDIYEKHPKLAKLKNWIKNAFNSIKKKVLKAKNEIFKSKDNNAKEEKAENEIDLEIGDLELDDFEEINQEDKKSNSKLDIEAEKLGLDDFMSKIKVITEGKSIEEQAKNKLEEFRKENRAREAEKFGQDYADKSDFRKKDNEGR